MVYTYQRFHPGSETEKLSDAINCGLHGFLKHFFAGVKFHFGCTLLTRFMYMKKIPHRRPSSVRTVCIHGDSPTRLEECTTPKKPCRVDRNADCSDY
jgi:hypothetical protein